MKQTQNQFYGKIGEMPSHLPSGAIYVSTDTDQTFAAGQDNVPVEISGGSSQEIQEAKDLALAGQSGYSHTGAFADKPLSNNYVWEAGAGIDYTQSDVDAGLWKVFSLSNSAHLAIDNPYWSTPVPSGNTGIGLFQGANLPSGVNSLFDYTYDYDTQYPPVILNSTEGYELTGESFMTIESTEFPDIDLHVSMSQVSTTGTGTGLTLSLTYKKAGPFNITSAIDPSNPVGTQLWKATTVKSVQAQGTGYVVNQDTITMEGLGGLATATIAYVNPYTSTGFEGSTGRIRLNDLEYGDQLRVRFDFNVIPQIANTTVEPALWYANRGIIDDITYTFPLTAQPIFYGQGTVGRSFLNRVEISAWITSDEDVNALTLPAIKSDNPVIIQPLGLLTTIIR